MLRGAKKVFFLILATLSFQSFGASKGEVANKDYEALEFEENCMIEVFPDKKEVKKIKKIEEKRLKSVGRKARKTVHLRRLNRLIKCASALVEEQYDGYKSSLQGLSLFEALSKKLEGIDYEYSFLYKKCRTFLKRYKKQLRKKRITSKVLDDAETEKYLKEVDLRFPENEAIRTIATQALNPKLICRRAFGFHMEFGIGGIVGFGGDHYSCWSPLGRKLHFSGPTGSGGVGAGIAINVGGSQNYNIVTDLHNLKNLKLTKSESQAVIFGYSKVEGNNDSSKETNVKLFPENKGSHDKMSGEGVLGSGWQKVVRRTALSKRVGLHHRFKETGLYDLLGVPVQIHF